MTVDLIHYREYPLGWAGRVVDAVWAVVWPAVVGAAVGLVVLVLGLQVMEQEGTLTAGLDDGSRASFGVSLLVLIGLWLLACLVSAARSLLYARRLARHRADPESERRPPTPSQRWVARALRPQSEAKPFAPLWGSGLLLAIIGGFLAVFSLVRLDSDGAVSALVGGAAAAAAGVGLIRLVGVLRRELAAASTSWRHSPTDPGNAEQKVRLVALPLRYRATVWADRVARALALAAAAGFAGAAALALGPAAGSPGLLPWVIEHGREPAAGVLRTLLVTGVALVLLLGAALVLELLRHSILLGVLDREATTDTTAGRGELPATRPDPLLTGEVLSERGPVRRGAQLLAGTAALVLVLARPAVAALEVRGDVAWAGGQATYLVAGAGVAILLAFGCELLTTGRDRQRRNRLLRTWPRAL
ncbi:hypothetical protein [Georgenia wangjunii]|uniref:hypothetical protein n=1 Tax=Georgenia wangjunii TaxID=3117730 RepID=UPI002F2657FA